MALYNNQNVAPLSFVAGAAISQYRAVKLDSTEGRVVASAAIADLTIGASMNSAAALGDLVTVQNFGKVKLTASAAISLGDQVMVTAAGAGKISTASGATAKSIGVALQAAGADGDVIEVQLAAPNVNGPANS